ncbi:PREDICTED: PERQ amino acid-rich with GYF domain-containing protein 2-like [Priapulus caudatus]|uniref:PERQ amino acid-rich with GYF domain-containing protein 2-like n=1 Tax=Priapulus caudatus TaxID=37621 RepID=A0ABM1DQE8_PRICU|nr:PREDICTED: PERQ amino acid-rich with GYF domain-containing protein 2-like [Priapulus caudatus]XP_014662170.1 PREDICTED: PERQ amino acid-rich with GYF domain-containing protein 2-like [Priapulus caudatus]
MSETLTFGPEWLRALSGGSSVTSPPPSPGLPKFKLAQYRYGREEMLALFNPPAQPPDDLLPVTSLVSEKSLHPLAFSPLSEDEQRSALQSVNSTAVLRVMGRGGPAGGVRGALRGGGVDRGRGRGRGREGWRGGPYDEEHDGFIRQRYDDRSSSLDDTKGLRGGFSRPFHSRGSFDELERDKPVERDAEGRVVIVRRGGGSGGEYSRSMSTENWRTRDRADDEDGGSAGGGGGGGWRTAHRSGERDKYGPKAGVSSWRERTKDDRADREFVRDRTRHGSQPRNTEREDGSKGGDLPEWSQDDPWDVDENVGTFDSSGAFMAGKGAEDGEADPPDEIRAGDASDQGDSSSNGANNNPTTNNNNHTAQQRRPSSETSDARADVGKALSAAAVKPGKQSDAQPERTSLSEQSAVAAARRRQHSGAVAPPGNGTEVPASSSSPSSSPGSNSLPVNSVEKTSASQPSATVAAREPPRPNPLASRGSPPSDNKPTVISHAPQQQQPKPAAKEGVADGASAATIKEEDYLDHIKKAAETLMETWTAEEELKQVSAPAQPASMALPLTHADALNWFYKDPEGDLQGPFQPSEMAEWFGCGFFPMNLLVKRGCDSCFLTLGEIIKRWDSVPFLPGLTERLPPLQSSSLTTGEVGAGIVPSSSSGSTQDAGHIELIQQQQQQQQQHYLQQQLVQQQIMQQQILLRQQAQLQQLVTLMKQDEAFAQLPPQQQQTLALRALMAQQQLMLQPKLPTSSPPLHIATSVDPSAAGLAAVAPSAVKPVPAAVWGGGGGQHTMRWPAARVEPKSVWDLDAPTSTQLEEMHRAEQAAKEKQQREQEEALRALQVREAEETRRREALLRQQMELQKKQQEERKRQEEEAKRKQEEQERQVHERQDELQQQQQQQQQQEELRRRDEQRKQQEQQRIQEEKKRQAERRRLAEQQRRMDEEEAEKRRQEEQQRQEQEERRLEAEEVERQRQQEIQRQQEMIRVMELKRQQEEAAQRAKTPAQLAPWAHHSQQQATGALSLARIQQWQEEKDQEAMEKQKIQVQQDQIQQQQQQQQQQQLKGSWVNRAPVNTAPQVKSLPQIQEEEARKLLRQKEKQVQQQKQQPASVPLGMSNWAAKTSANTNNWGSNGTAIWGDAKSQGKGFWEEDVAPVKTKKFKNASNSKIDPDFPSLSPAKGKKTSSATNAKKEPRSQKEAENVMKLFEQKRPMDEFTQWCNKALSDMQHTLDVRRSFLPEGCRFPI